MLQVKTFKKKKKKKIQKTISQQQTKQKEKTQCVAILSQLLFIGSFGR